MSCNGVTGRLSRLNVTGTLVTISVFGMLCRAGYTLSQYVYYDDETYYYRKGIRGGYYIIDIRLTADPGWTGVEDTDWENVFKIKDE